MAEEAKPKVVGGYKLTDYLGCGRYRKVRLGVNCATNEQFAIKILEPGHMKKTQQDVELEIAIWRLMDHPNIVKLHEVVVPEDTRLSHLVLELAHVGKLQDYLRRQPNGKVDENEARKLFRQIISGVEYCHAVKVLHLGLSTENLLLDKNNNIKIADFGEATVLQPVAAALPPSSPLKRCCSSIIHASPQMMAKENPTPSDDIWALGVILYNLVCGKDPWLKTEFGLYDSGNIRSGKYDEQALVGLSEECKSLINSIFKPVTSERVTLEQIRTHAWVNLGLDPLPSCPSYDYPPTKPINEDIVRQLRNYGFTDVEARRGMESDEITPATAVYNVLAHKQALRERERTFSS